jgi:hypothetical protein
MQRVQRATFRFIALGIAAGLACGSAAAQARDCTYERCFLRLQEHPLAVVQGLAATPVTELGLFSSPRIDVLAARADSARIHYEAFRGAYNRTRAFAVIGIAADIGAVLVFSGNPRANQGAALRLFTGGAVCWLAGMGSGAYAQSQLNQAIALYNRSLPDTPRP